VAGGCIACMQCHIGQCVTGIATQDPEHEKRYKPDVESQNIHRFFESVRWQIAAITHSLGYDDVRQLCRDDLVALTTEAAAITGLALEPEHRDETDAIAIKAG
jgi:glutamate synthase domain-containing protein 2